MEKENEYMYCSKKTKYLRYRNSWVKSSNFETSNDGAVEAKILIFGGDIILKYRILDGERESQNADRWSGKI